MTLNHDQKNLSKIFPSVDSTYHSIREILGKAPKYKLYLPSEEELKEELEKVKQFLELKLKEKRKGKKLLEGE